MANFYNKKHFFEFVFPIENLKLYMRGFSVGRTTFLKYTNYKFNNTMKELRKIINKKSFKDLK